MRRDVVGFALVSGLAVLAVWSARGGRRAGGRPETVLGDEPAAADRPVELAQPARVAEAEGARRAAPAGGRPTIAGRVVVPGGIPSGEDVRVLASVFFDAMPWSHGVQPLSAAVDAHGAFALRVPKGTDHVQL